MTNICLYLYLLLIVADGSYFSRIGNMYHGVYLKETLQPSSSPTYWIFRDNMNILTPDANYQLCINVTKHLDLCNDTMGLKDTEWGYEIGSMGLYTISAGDRYYLTLNGTGAGVTQQQTGNSDKILLSPATGNTDTPLVATLGKAVKTLRQELDSVRANYSKLLEMKDGMVNNSALLADQARKAEEDYDGKVKMIADKFEYYKTEVEEMKQSMTKEIQVMNTTQYNMATTTLPSISDYIEDMRIKPDQFLDKLKTTDLESSLKTQITEINKTLSSYLHKHRIAPVSVYDWLILLTTLLYILYFVDIIGRTAGWKCFSTKSTVRTELEMQMENPTSIPPEYFIQEEGEAANFERTRASIKGKLHLKPVE